MSRVPATPTVRRRRLAVDLLLFLVLLALLAFLFLSSQTPYLTEKQALAGTQAIYLYGPGDVLARTETEDTVFYLLQDGDSYALCGLTRRNGPLWSAGGLTSVVRDRTYPMTALPTAQYLLVIVNDPDIAEVDVLCYDRFSGGFHSLNLPQVTAGDCYLFQYPDQQTPYKFSSGDFLLRGYDAEGALRYETAAPDHWTEQWGLTIPEAR